MEYKVVLQRSEEGVAASVNAYTMGGIAQDAGLTVEGFKKLL